MKRRLWTGAICLALCAPGFGGARAASPSPEQAASLEAQVLAWLRAALGAPTRLPDRPLRLTAQADHYDVLIPLTQDGAGLTAEARLGDTGVWTITTIRLPSPATYTIDIARLAGLPPPTGGLPAPTLRLDTKIADQDAQALFDPTHATASSLQGTYKAVRLQIDGPGTHQVQHFDTYSFTLTDQPAADGRADLAQTSDIDGYASQTVAPGAAETRVTMRHLHQGGQLLGWSRPQGAASFQALTAVVQDLPIGGAPDAIARARLRALILALRDLFRGVDLAQTADGLRVDSPQLAFSAEHASLAMGATAPSDLLDAHLDFALEGLSVPSIPTDAGGDLVPRHIAFRPRLSGLSLHDLTGLALSALDPAAQPADLLIQSLALLGHGGIGLGIDTLAFDLGPATFSATGQARVTSLQQNQGEARITATGVPALIARVRQIPDLAELADTLDICVQLGRKEGDRLLWALTLRDSRLLVNGQDVLAPGPTQTP